MQNGQFSLKGNSSNAITKNLFADGWPQIKGYVSASPKTGANVLLASAEKDDPILSVMQYGLGHTVAWNTDVTNRWTAGLAQQNDYVQLWKRIIDYSAGNTALGEDRVDVTTVNGTTKVTYYAKDYAEQTQVEAVYTDPDGKTHQAKLTASAPGTYEAQLDTTVSGVYNLSVQRKNGKKIENALTTAAVVQYSQEYKFALTNDSFCAFIKQYGKVLSPKKNVWKKLKASGRARVCLTNPLLILLLFGAGSRKTKGKDKESKTGGNGFPGTRYFCAVKEKRKAESFRLKENRSHYAIRQQFTRNVTEYRP